MTVTAHPRGGGDRPMPGIAFRGMSTLFRIRDLVRPRSVLLDEVPLRAGDTVVDYGCGPGSYIPELSRRVGSAGRVVAVDIHRLAIERVEGLARRRGLRNVEAHVGDGVHIPGVADGAVDIVILCDIFHMLGDRESVLVEIARVLGAVGVLVVNDPHMDPNLLVAGVTRGPLPGPEPRRPCDAVHTSRGAGSAEDRLMNVASIVSHRGMRCPARFGWRGHHPQVDHHRPWRSRSDAALLALLDAEDVQAVVLNRRDDARVLRSLRCSRDWVVDYSDPRSVILVRAG